MLPLENAATEFGNVRRVVLASGNPTQLAHLRLCTARVEARKGNLLEAHRHWKAASDLLADGSNPKLRSQFWLDGITISLLRGDARSALEAVEQATTFANESGYFRSIIGAQVDRAHVMHVLGDLEAGRKIAEAAVQAARPYRQMSVAALDCLANILIAQGEIASAEVVFTEISNLRPKHGSKLAPHWDVLSELSSRFALARAKPGREEAERIVEQGVRTATETHESTWLIRMQLALAELRLESGD